MKFKGKKWYTTNDVYRAGYNQFYVFEIKDGWCRVYSKITMVIFGMNV